MTTTAYAPKSDPPVAAAEPDRPIVASAGPAAITPDQIDALLRGGPAKSTALHVGNGDTGAAGVVTTSAHATAPEVVDLGDVELDSGKQYVTGHRQFFHTFSIFNLGGHEAYPTLSYQGDPQLQIIAKPSRLRPSHESPNPADDIKLVYSPTARGVHRGVITASLRWQRDLAPEELRIPVVAAAHRPGEPTNAESAAKEASDAAAAAAAAQDATEVAASEAEFERLRVRDEASSTYLLDEATELAGESGRSLSEKQRTGIGTAQGEVEKYKRRKPATSTSLLERLALLAVDIASAAIGWRIGASLGRRLGSLVIDADVYSPPKNAGVDMAEAGRARRRSRTLPQLRDADSGFEALTEAVQAGIGGLARLGVDQVGGSDTRRETPEGNGTPGQSDDPLLAFFEAQRTLVDDNQSVRYQAIIRSRRHLVPLVRKDENRAVSAMNAVKESLEESAVDAANTQATESVRQWTRYVLRTALACPDGEVTKLDAGNHAPQEKASPSGVDGLLDIGFEADHDDPTAPVRVKTATMRGISRSAARRFAHDPLIDQAIPIRAFGLPSESVAVLPITVTRDEAGKIQFTDETGGPGESRWLSRKAGNVGRAQLAGARKLMNEEIASKSLDAHGVTLETDDASAQDE